MVDRPARFRRRRRLHLSPVFVVYLAILLLNCIGTGNDPIPSAFLRQFGVDGAKADEEEKSQVRRRSEASSQMNSSDKPLSLNQILIRAGKRGLGGGIPGALAGMVQVFTLMWLRTIINYQCRYGTTFQQALQTLLRDGGIRRLYRGLSFALVQAPLARFVSTAANDGVDALLANFQFASRWGAGRKTFFASVVVGIARILLMRK